MTLVYFPTLMFYVIFFLFSSFYSFVLKSVGLGLMFSLFSLFISPILLFPLPLISSITCNYILRGIPFLCPLIYFLVIICVPSQLFSLKFPYWFLFHHFSDLFITDSIPLCFPAMLLCYFRAFAIVSKFYLHIIQSAV